MPRRLPSLTELYDAMFDQLGPQHWWPGELPIEVPVGAVLVQNTAWRNVVKAISQLKAHDLLDIQALHEVSPQRLETLLQPSGYYRIKTKRLKNLMRFLVEVHGGSLDSLYALDIDEARGQLLSVNGIGPETADCILLYGGEMPRFVVDAYTRRILLRHDWIDPPAKYHNMQQLFERRLPADAQLFNEFHALIVAVGNQHCRATPRCEGCPLQDYLPRGGPCEI